MTEKILKEIFCDTCKGAICELKKELSFLENFIKKADEDRENAIIKYGSIAKIPKNVLVLLRINTLSELRIRKEELTEKINELKKQIK
jgi:hypothetical protein